MAKRKVDWIEVELLEGREARIRYQLEALELFEGWVNQPKPHGLTDSLGIKGLAVKMGRARSGRLYTDEQVERGIKFLMGMVELGIFNLTPSKHLPAQDQPLEYHMISLNLDALPDAKTRINNQR